MRIHLGTFFNNSTVSYSWKVAIGNGSTDSVASTLAVQNLQDSVSAHYYNSASNDLPLLLIYPAAPSSAEQFQVELLSYNVQTNTSANSSLPPRPLPRRQRTAPRQSVIQGLAIYEQSNDATHHPSAPHESQVESIPLLLFEFSVELVKLLMPNFFLLSSCF